MSDVKWNHTDLKLKNFRRNPIVMCKAITPEIMQSLEVISDADAEIRFDPLKHSLKTWNRKEGLKVNDPHFIGVRKQTPLHTDKAYPRYSHQILLRCDNFLVRGLDLVETPLCRGTYFVLDGHSPHQLHSTVPKNNGMYVAISIDNHYVMHPDIVINHLIYFAKNNLFKD